MGAINKFGTSATGSVAAINLIGPSPAIGAGQFGQITDWGATAVAASANTAALLQRSSDGFVANIVTLDRIEIPTSGTVLKTFASPFKLLAGEQFRVQATQGTIGAESATVSGTTENANGSPGGDDIRD